VKIYGFLFFIIYFNNKKNIYVSNRGENYIIKNNGRIKCYVIYILLYALKFLM